MEMYPERMTTLAIFVVVVVVSAVAVSSLVSETGAPTPSTNVRVDNYAAPDWSLGNGLEPNVVVGPEGVIYVAWIGLVQERPTYALNSSTLFESQIFFSESSDGRTFTAPVQVSNGSLGYFDPSIALSSSGGVYIAYLGAKVPAGQSYLYLAARDGTSDRFRTSKVTEAGVDVDRPWLEAAGNGTLYLVYDTRQDTFMISSSDRGESFSFPIMVAANAWATGAVISNGTIYVAMLSYREYWTYTQLRVLLGVMEAGTRAFTVHNPDNISVTYSLVGTAPAASHPGASVVASGNHVELVYSAANGTQLWLAQSTDYGEHWFRTILLQSPFGSMIQEPWTALSPDGATVAVAWQGNATGFWRTYLTTAGLAPVTTGGSIIVSNQGGYPSSVLNWHGDFIADSYLGPSAVLVVWTDGRALATDFGGDGHIYSSVVRP